VRLTEREPLDLATRTAERQVKDARFSVIKTMEDCDFKAQQSINEPVVGEFLPGEFIENQENIVPVGNSGTGKTHLACAL